MKVQLVPHTTCPKVKVEDYGTEYLHPDGIRRRMRALEAAAKWLEAELKKLKAKK